MEMECVSAQYDLKLKHHLKQIELRIMKLNQKKKIVPEIEAEEKIAFWIWTLETPTGGGEKMEKNYEKYFFWKKIVTPPT